MSDITAAITAVDAYVPEFVLTNKLDKVCDELGWNEAEVEACGGVNEYMRKHEKVGDSLLAN